MKQNRVDSLDTAFAPGFGARAEGATPVRVEHPTPPAGAAPVPKHRSWLRLSVSIVRDAAIAVALMAMVPIAFVSLRGDYIWRNGDVYGDVRARIARVEGMRPFTIPTDASITPMQAGLAFAAMQVPPRQAIGFELREPATRPAASWREAAVEPGMFANNFSNLDHLPNSGSILEVVARGITPAEAKFLRILATAPIWREFDLVSRAPAVDLVGGRYLLPFPTTAAIYDMPMTRFNQTKELAHAAVSRAAHHMSIGQRDSAEAVLRSIVSFGFALVDNGTTSLDELIGNVIIGVGRDGLRRFYNLTSDPRITSSALAPLAPMKKSDGGPRGPRLSLDEMRAKHIANAGDKSLPPGVRYLALTQLSASTCTNVPELLFGRRQDVSDAIANARRDLARYPSERAVVDLISRLPESRSSGGTGVARFAASAGTVAGTVLRNPSLGFCSRLIGGNWE